ncbi:MAG: TerB N-terminal domain-containing protein [Clostridia bacterium]|nr:TerB N-terminal domain-containing protein [Clostridia bacterium]
MAENRKKNDRAPQSPESLADEIRRTVREKVRASLGGVPGTTAPSDTGVVIEDLPAVELEVDSLSSVDRVSRTAEPAQRESRTDDFWDLGKPKPKVYARPDFKDHSLTVTDIGAADPEVRETPVKTAAAEKIIPREEFMAKHTSSAGRVVNTVDGPRSIATSDYRRRTAVKKQAPPTPKKRVMNPEDSIVRSYAPDGFLIDKIDVRLWESEVEFYGRFATDARLSHDSRPVNPPDASLTPEPFFSYVPQYAHMTAKQVETYRWVRENIRLGRTPACDMPYILLYIYEIINLPDVILPADGVKLLTRIWLGYRGTIPRLDSLLCEWFADYCMIHAQPLPREILPILREIVPKAQFKEFYLNLSENELDEIGHILIEVSSDYDFRSSRYYKPNRDAYEEHIPKAVSTALAEQYRSRRGIFPFDRTYKMTRDSYCGAIVSSGIKRRIDLEFRSFTRRADFRECVTFLVKYAENKLRQAVGVKAKLGVDRIAAEDMAVIDRYFAPLIPEKKQKRPAEDAYMPADYMKNYESEDSGFDFSAALAIEQESWVNTSRLTGDEYHEAVHVPEYDPDESVTVDGEMTVDDEIPVMEVPEPDVPDMPEAPAADDTTETNNTESDDLIREGLAAALEGRFRAWCRERGLYEGEAADRINTVFLDELGDVVLEDSGAGFALIEDYREDVEQWL